MRMRTVVAMVVAVIVCVWAVEGWGWGWPKPQSITPQTQEVDTVAGTVERYFSRGMSCSGKIGDLSWFIVQDALTLCSVRVKKDK